MKTNNYIGKQDENRGIITFVIVFVVILLLVVAIVVASKLLEKGDNRESLIDNMYTELQKTSSNITRFELDGSCVILEGEYKENVNENLLSRLVNLELVLKNSDGDIYEYPLNYFISTDGIDFKTYDDENEENKYLCDLKDIAPGEYFVFVRTKTESSKTDEGYVYKYYTLENSSDSNERSFGNTKIFFDKSNKVESFMSVVKQDETAEKDK